MKVNVPNYSYTHNGAPSPCLTPQQQLTRLVLACMLFEDTFYESGQEISVRIADLCTKVPGKFILELIKEAAFKHHLRHISLFLIVQLLKHKECPKNLWQVIGDVLIRPDMMTDLLALYWKNGKVPLARQLRRGLAKAFTRFDEYQLSKYNRDNAIKLRDVLFLCHAKPMNEDQAALWKRLINNTLKTPDTWETRLSAGENKQESFQELLEKGKMGTLAILRNVRNMSENNVDKEIVAKELLRSKKPMRPFQYLSAAKACPIWEDVIDKAMIQSCSYYEKLPGKTIVLVDVSGSMDAPLSQNPNKPFDRADHPTTRLDAACGLAILMRECCPNLMIFSFSNSLAPIAARSGMALRDAIYQSQIHSGTYLGNALQLICSKWIFDRIVVITDEQSSDRIPHMPHTRNYILNIAPYQQGIGTTSDWVTISGFSEAFVDYIREVEKFDLKAIQLADKDRRQL